MGTDRENVVPGNLIIIWKLNEAWPLKKNSYGHFLTALKAFKTQRELHHCLTALKGFNFEKWLRHILVTRKVYQIAILYNAGQQPLLKVAYHIIFIINDLHLLLVPNFIAIGIYFLSGTKFFWNEEAECVLNVPNECYLTVILIFLVATARYLSVTTG